MLTSLALHRPHDPKAHDFAHVDTWVFDLDNTLYAANADIFPQVDARIREYTAHILGLDLDAAYTLQKGLYRKYGTSLRGLMLEHGVDPQPFLDYVHDIDYSALQPDPALASALERLPGRRYIMTNGTTRHAMNTVAQLGIAPLFEDVFDIVAADLIPKPDGTAYEKMFRDHAIAPKAAAMFEDLPRNLTYPHHVGMKTVLVVPRGHKPSVEALPTADGAAIAGIDYVTDDLAGFLDLAMHGADASHRR
jgi:putative hydrolase of the HAD superfamily